MNDLHSFLCKRRGIGDVETFELCKRGLLSDKLETLGDERLEQCFSLQALETFALLNIQDPGFGFFSKCAVPETIHIQLMECHWKFLGGGGRSETLKSQNFNFLVGGEGVQNKTPSMGVVWIIFWNCTLETLGDERLGQCCSQPFALFKIQDQALRFFSE